MFLLYAIYSSIMLSDLSNVSSIVSCVCMMYDVCNVLSPAGYVVYGSFVLFNVLSNVCLSFGTCVGRYVGLSVGRCLVCHRAGSDPERIWSEQKKTPNRCRPGIFLIKFVQILNPVIVNHPLHILGG